MLVGHAGEDDDARGWDQAKLILAQIAKGELQNSQSKSAAGTTTPASLPTHGVTLRQAWARYLTAHLERKERSPATIKGYADHVERVLSDWLDLPLQVLGENPVMVAERHDRMSNDNGPSAANGAMRTLRAIYNHARKSHRELPPEPHTCRRLEQRKTSQHGHGSRGSSDLVCPGTANAPPHSTRISPLHPAVWQSPWRVAAGARGAHQLEGPRSPHSAP